MSEQFPGPKTREVLERGIPLFRNGLRFDQEMQKANRRGFRSANQIVVDRALGDYIWDMDGKRYIDFQNGWATNPVGNAHPEIIDAVDAAHRRYGFHYDHPLRYELAERLAEIMPAQALPRFNYEVSGTEAVEAAVHLALTYTQRRYIITFSSAYHGVSLSTKLMCGFGSEQNRYLEAWTGGIIKAPYPFSDRTPAGMTQEQYVDYCLWYLDNHIPDCIASRNSIAGVMIEPGLAEGGNWIPPTNFLRGIRELCDKNDWLMIADEVLTGIGRTGKMWAVSITTSFRTSSWLAKTSRAASHRAPASRRRTKYLATTTIFFPGRRLRDHPQAVLPASRRWKFTSGTISSTMPPGSDSLPQMS